MRIAAPPSPLASSQPLLAPTLLELAHERALQASSTILPPSTQSSEDNALETPPSHSERSGIILAIIDSLPFLRVEDLEEFLPLTARLINSMVVAEPQQDIRATCIDRFWDVLSGGEMDVDRANFCVTWWCTRGGRELLLFGEHHEQQQQQQPVPEEPLMSGAVVDVARESKL